MKIHEEQAEIRKGAGLQLEQLTSQSREGTTTNSRIQPFDMDELEEAFLLSDMTPVELPLLHTSQKDSSTILCHSSSDAKSTLASTLAGSSSTHTSLQIMDNVPSVIIIIEGITHSRNDPLTMTFLSTESNQEFGGMESDFHITEQMDELGSVTRRGRLIKPTQKYQGMEWMTMRGRGKRGRKGRSS
ncbi:hypothetical protein F2Q68_00007262 [Brassica cretica]|uniref:Uncharacterized protein n=2 Tax=Brassica cretica TaxID=69181 RepID=A0A8S9L4X0_BRACR|nr:hypothetical protein F2Q68_00007262 [Brassica cretica]